MSTLHESRGPDVTPPAFDLVLASASPRRRELLERAGLRLRIVAADLDETSAPGERPAAYVERIAAAKASAIASRATIADAGLAVLAADTTVVVDDHILGKPRDGGDAAAMLRALAGRSHQVLTAYRIRYDTASTGRVVSTEVALRAISAAEIAAYVDSREWDGKAGGYAIQGIAAVFVTAVFGSITNVIGLPLSEVIEDLRAIGALPAYPAHGFGTSSELG